MEKYKLAKDLPFVKAGSEINYDPDNNGNHPCFQLCSEDCDNPDTFWYRITCDVRDFDKLISEGWIVEIKTKEWYEIVFGEQLNQRIRFNTLREAMEHNHTYFEFKNYDIVKVREVLE